MARRMDRRTGDSNLRSLLNRREAIVAIAAACCANVDRVRTALAAEPRQESETRAESLDWDKSRREAFAQKELDEYNAVARKNGFPANGRVKTTPRFVVVYNASEAYAEWVAALAEEVAKGFEKFAVKLGFKRVKLTKPLSIFVFAERALFDVWERKLSPPSENEGARLGRSMGFYATGIDRMFVYDQTEIEAYRVRRGGSAKRKTPAIHARTRQTRRSRYHGARRRRLQYVDDRARINAPNVLQLRRLALKRTLSRMARRRTRNDYGTVRRKRRAWMALSQ